MNVFDEISRQGRQALSLGRKISKYAPVCFVYFNRVTVIFPDSCGFRHRFVEEFFLIDVI